jgi:ankyrin repeat protein
MDPANRNSPAEHLSPKSFFWARELLPLVTALLLIGGTVEVAFGRLVARQSAMWQLHQRDTRLEDAAKAVGPAIDDNDADALTAALVAGPVLGPNEAKELLRRCLDNFGKADVARVLLEHCIDVRQLPGSYFQQAIDTGKHDLARLMIEKGFDVNKGGEQDDRPPLAFVLAGGDKPEAVEMFEFLLEHGADPSGRTKPLGSTILHTLVQSGDIFKDPVRIAELLVAHGADVNAQSEDGKPLRHADEGDPHPLIQFLRSKGATR